ncbi:MAG TPA: hypothetical protein VKZ54_09060 [Membranihabitans sp.]|nr:hypothetical protein [Membranihabitans sp.]
MNYGEWVPACFGRVSGDTLCFTSMGRELIYRAGYYSEKRHHFITRPFLLDFDETIQYSEPDRNRSIVVRAGKINHGEESGVVAGQNYTLRYLNSEGTWVDHAMKQCKRDGELYFRDVPAGAFYMLSSSSDRRNLARIFLIGEDGEQLWY